jgi:D-alanyl-D-alanine carboxypeptidase
LGVGRRHSTYTGGSEGYLKMKKTLFLFSFILWGILAGCAHNTHHSNFRTPITLPMETIKSNGSVIHEPFSKDKTAFLEKEVENIIMATGAKGISASIGVPDHGIWCSARGVTGNPSKEKMTSHLKLFAGSIGKIFTAIVILNLIEEGRLSLESSVEKWFPGMRRASHVTIDHLLTHTSGIAGFDNRKEYESHKYRYGNPEELISYVTEKELLFEPGKHYAYSNTGYLMLGIIIERVTGRPYEEAVKHYIIDKINLQETEVITSETMNDLIVKGHHKGNVLNESENYVVPFAAGSIAATPRDLIVFLQSLMSGRLLSQGSLQMMFSDMNLMTAPQSTYYGKGIVAALRTPAGDIIGHTGGIKGFGASLYYHPKRNIFVCVMMNDDGKAVDPAMFKLLEEMMEM